MANPIKATFTTPDGVDIAGLYRAAAKPRGVVLLVHMMPATKESWDGFAERLAERGWSSLAIDLRGHGESVRQVRRHLDYRDFKDEEHRSSTLDLETSALWIRAETGFGFDRLRLAGASIGANLALDFAAQHGEVERVLALSPGLNYHSLTPEIGFSAYRPGQCLMLAASEEDAYAYSSALELARIPTSAVVSVKKLHAAGHGTAMLERDPALMDEVADWLCVGS
jgi:alpha-beta hydrolase superfamily lysophospholipase